MACVWDNAAYRGVDLCLFSVCSGSGKGICRFHNPHHHRGREGDTLTIAAAGDVNVTQALLDSARGADGSYDFSRMILGAAPLLSGADLTVADLEVNFCGAPYDPAAYNAPESLLTALSGAGVDLVQTANTVSVYNGVAGLSSTLAAVERAGLLPVGTFATEEQARQTKGFYHGRGKGLSGGLCGLYQRCRKPAAAGGCGRLCEPPLYRLQHHISGRRHRGNSSHSLPRCNQKSQMLSLLCSIGAASTTAL